MTREEALKIVRENYPHFGTTEPWLDLEKALATLVPELRESEDERIRRFLITIVNNLCAPNFKDVEKKDVLAYLEKQKPADLPAGFYVTLPDGKKYYTKEMRCNGMNVKVVEPKPAEWSEEDKNGMFSDIIMAIRAFYKCEREDLVDYVKSLRPSWKPSEDEERLTNTSISFLKDFADKGYENAVECIDWLKSKLNGNSGK